jgi:hypothetical protein
MEIIISKSEIESLLDDQVAENELTEAQKQLALEDLNLGDYEEWIEQDFLYVKFKYAHVTVSKYL